MTYVWDPRFFVRIWSSRSNMNSMFEGQKVEVFQIWAKISTKTGLWSSSNRRWRSEEVQMLTNSTTITSKSVSLKFISLSFICPCWHYYRINIKKSKKSRVGFERVDQRIFKTNTVFLLDILAIPCRKLSGISDV